MELSSIIDLERIDEYREDNQIEAKAAQGGLPDTLWDSYSAFANTDGGCILLGVKEREDHTLKVVGLKDAAKMKKDFWNMVNNRQKISVNLMTEHRVRIEKVGDKEIIVLEVPRADRTSRPVYKGMDPRIGTYRRNDEGDYLCSLEEVSAMFRDAALSPQDAKVLTQMDMSVFCEDTVRGYRQVFRSTHPNHMWNRLEDEIFLRRIGAMANGEDGIYHPTAAGLLMFGYEYEILREFPQYFLDYQENRQMAATRWTDRVVSSSGEWSGNLFDFVYKIVPILTAGLKVPFVLRGMQRMDDTPVHKILREAVTNACAHADFYGRRGLVISKTADGFTFANPGSMRVAKKDAIEGGVSDPRNGVILKMFSLINYGERAGSGLCNIFKVWEHVYHTPAQMTEETGDPNRVIVSLLNGGHEQDVKAMLELYDNPEELTFPDDDNLYGTERVSDKSELFDDLSDKSVLKDKIAKELSDKPKMSDRLSDILSDIFVMACSNDFITTSAVAAELSLDARSVRRYITRLVDYGYLVAEGGNKNKKYRRANN
jgi:predicted HTH transcriptional regulator